MSLVVDFHKAHGGRPLKIEGMLYYEDGAMRDTDPNGMLIDPPLDKRALLKNKLIFQQEVLRIKTAHYQGEYESMKARAAAASKTTSRLRNVVIAPQEHEIQALEVKAEEIRALQHVVAVMQQQYNDLVYPPALRQRDEDQAARIASAGAESLARIQKLRI